MKDELSRKIMEEFVRLRAKTESSRKDDGREDKKGKSHKKLCHKKETLIQKF